MPIPSLIAKIVLSVVLFNALIFAPTVFGQQSNTASAPEWEKLVEAAKKEGRVTVSLPVSAELKKRVEEQFKTRYGFEVEVFAAPAGAAVRRIADEFKAGVRYFDLHIGGATSIVSGMLDEGIIDPIDPWLVLPEVKDPKQWWGGHLWVDNAKKFIYTFQAFLPQTIWYNTEMVKPEEFHSLDEFLNPKWKGKIGFLDPRRGGGGDANWGYMWQVKGENYLKKLAAQDLYLGRDQRVLAESLVKKRVAVVIGLSYYSYAPFLKAGLPIKALPTPKEGTYGTSGSGNLAIIKTPAHPNATKVFINWLLSREGQTIFSRALGQATRRLDVDTGWLRESGTIPAKDAMSITEFLQVENQSEEKIDKMREPAAKAAHSLLK